jgi:hypothetical protein
MLNDGDYLSRLHSLFKELPYRNQCKVLTTFRNVSASSLASSFQKILIALLRGKYDEALRAKRSDWLGIISILIMLAIITAGFICTQPPETNAKNGIFLLCIFLALGDAFPIIMWAEPVIKLRNYRKKLKQQDVDPQRLEEDIVGVMDSECSFSEVELRSAFSSDSAKEQFFKKLYARPWKMQRVTFQRFQSIVEPDLRTILAASAKAEANRRTGSAVKGLIAGLVAGGIVWFWYASIPPHGYGPNAGPFLFVLAEALFIVVCAVIAPVSLVLSISAFAAGSRYNRMAKALSR